MERMTLKEAAARYGYRGPNTLRQAASRGNLQTTIEHTPRGPVRYVTVHAMEDYIANRPAWHQDGRLDLPAQATTRRPPGIGQRLYEARRRLGLSQRALGRRASVTGAAISAIERGEGKRPRAATVERLAAALGVDPRWLVKGESEEGA